MFIVLSITNLDTTSSVFQNKEKLKVKKSKKKKKHFMQPIFIMRIKKHLIFFSADRKQNNNS